MQGKWTTQIWQDVLNLSTQKHREGQKKQILGGRLGDLFWSRLYFTCQNFPWWLSGKESACQFKRHGFNPWVGKIPWNRKWQPSPVSFLGNPMDRGAWWAAIHGVTKSQIQLSHWKTSTYYVPIRKPKDIEICKHIYTHTHTHTHTYVMLFVIRIIFLIVHQRPKIKTSLLSLTFSFLITILLLLPKCFQFYHHSVSSQFPSPFWILPSFSSLWIPWCTEMQAQFLLPAYFSSMKLQGLDSCSIHLPAGLLWCPLVVSSAIGAVPSHRAVIFSLP